MNQTIPSSAGPAVKSDYEASIVAGLLIGLFSLPILFTAYPELFPKVWPIAIIFFLVAAPTGIYIASRLTRFLPIIWQIAKFVLVGGLNALMDIGVLAALQTFFRSSYDIDPNAAILSIGGIALAYYALYKALSFLVANVNSFFWNKLWIFSGNATKDGAKEFGQFLVVSIVGFLLNIFFASFIFSSVAPFGGINTSQWGLLCAVFGSLAGLVWNFLGYKLIVFKK
ncbi:MAG TPA: GtrA family protein [Candidatus Fimivivens sp.]|nr:GtrA family protein [Candidatus Fimivivens sp.]